VDDSKSSRVSAMSATLRGRLRTKIGSSLALEVVLEILSVFEVVEMHLNTQRSNISDDFALV
jgi:hypothetical protein